MLYRESLAAAAARLGMEVRRYPRKTDPAVLAADAMGVDVAEVTSIIARFGREAGTPWRKDHKMAPRLRCACSDLGFVADPAMGRSGDAVSYDSRWILEQRSCWCAPTMPVTEPASCPGCR